MTLTYKLYTYENGLGQPVFKAQYKGGLWQLWRWTWIENPIEWLHGALEWDTREQAMAGIRRHAENRRADEQLKRLAAKREKLKLIVVEEVEG